LKLWFVIRSFGILGIREKFRLHLKLAQWVKKQVEAAPDFELLAPVALNTVCFRYLPEGIKDEGEINNLNEKILTRINKTGKIFITHTKLNGKYTIRMSIGQTETTEKHVEQAWGLIKEMAHIVVSNN
jgi:aromatic-L-amino-acid/L-tryptophan decarboxylase